MGAGADRGPWLAWGTGELSEGGGLGRVTGLPHQTLSCVSPPPDWGSLSSKPVSLSLRKIMEVCSPWS